MSQHKSMFKKSSNAQGFVQCVIKPEFFEEFTGMGFVDHIDKLKTKRTRKAKEVVADENNEG